MSRQLFYSADYARHERPRGLPDGRMLQRGPGSATDCEPRVARKSDRQGRLNSPVTTRTANRHRGRTDPVRRNTLLESAGLPTSDLDDAQLQHFFFIGTASVPDRDSSGSSCAASMRCCAHLSSPRQPARAAPAPHLSGMPSTCAVAGRARPVPSHDDCGGLLRAPRLCPHRPRGAPESIRSTREFADICPASSAFMVKHL